jgi:hypothetical protein
MKSAILEREAGDPAAERALLSSALTRFPQAWKLHLMLGQLEDRVGNTDAARAAYVAGVKQCLDATPLWTGYAALEEKAGECSAHIHMLHVELLSLPSSPHSCLFFLFLHLFLSFPSLFPSTLLQPPPFPANLPPGNLPKARAVLEQARLKNPKSPPLWLAAIRLEVRANNGKAAETQLAKALQVREIHLSFFTVYELKTI